MDLTGGLGLILAVLIGIIISSLPLYFAVKLLGGHASILKVFITNVLVGFLSAWLVSSFGFGSLVVLLVVILLYSFIFQMGIVRSFFAWLIQYIVAALLILLGLFFFGISLTGML